MTDSLGEAGINLPTYVGLADDDIDRICDLLRQGALVGAQPTSRATDLSTLSRQCCRPSLLRLAMGMMAS